MMLSPRFVALQDSHGLDMEARSIHLLPASSCLSLGVRRGSLHSIREGRSATRRRSLSVVQPQPTILTAS